MAGPIYTFTSDTPQAPNAMNQTAPLIRANFQAINELINVNHVGFNTSDSGKHNCINMQFQTVDPGTDSNDLSVYSKATGSPNVAEIFYQYPDNGTVHQLTPTTSAGGGGTSSATSGTGWCLFPSGILFKWGTASVNLQQSGYIVFPTGSGIPAYKSGMSYAKVTLAQSTSANTNF